MRVSARRAAVRPDGNAVLAVRRADVSDEVMTAADVAEILRVDRKTVYDHVSRGRIPHKRLGRRVIFSRTAIMAWLSGAPA
jgi:excisionase family DNA binding protein